MIDFTGRHKKRKKMVQVKLVREDTEVVTWLPCDSRIKVGVKLTLKQIGTDMWFEVAEIYNTIDREQIHIDWKVGGL